MQDIPTEMQIEIERLKTEDSRIWAELSEQRSTIVVQSAAIARLETVVNNIDQHIEGIRTDVGAQFKAINTRLDTALSSTLRALPPWAAGIAAIGALILGALLEHYGIKGLL